MFKYPNLRVKKTQRYNPTMKRATNDLHRITELCREMDTPVEIHTAVGLFASAHFVDMHVSVGLDFGWSLCYVTGSGSDMMSTDFLELVDKIENIVRE